MNNEHFNFMSSYKFKRKEKLLYLPTNEIVTYKKQYGPSRPNYIYVTTNEGEILLTWKHDVKPLS